MALSGGVCSSASSVPAGCPSAASQCRSPTLPHCTSLGLDRPAALVHRRQGLLPGWYLDGRGPLPNAVSLKFVHRTDSKTARKTGPSTSTVRCTASGSGWRLLTNRSWAAGWGSGSGRKWFAWVTPVCGWAGACFSACDNCTTWSHMAILSGLTGRMPGLGLVAGMQRRHWAALGGPPASTAGPLAWISGSSPAAGPSAPPGACWCS